MNRNGFLNLALRESLQWGLKMGCPLVERVGEQLPELAENALVELCEEAQEARDWIHQYILDHYDPKEGAPRAEDVAAARYPWSDKENLSHAVSQGLYYAWHG